jgi:hypothetical protein
MKSFEDFANSTIQASAILTEDEIEALTASGNAEDSRKLWLYAYRIASFVTVYARQKLPTNFDELDWQDAVQECMIQYPTVLANYDKRQAPFLRYMSSAFQFIIRRYMWGLNKGGMGSADTAAMAPLSFEDTRDNAAQVFDNMVGHTEAFGTRDPLIEAMAEDDVKAALLAANAAYVPSRRRGRPWTPAQRALEA